MFKEARGRAPNNEELYALRRVWLDNEVLYREGLALGLEKGDKAIRERVIFKSLSVVDASVKRPPVEESMLRKWFESNRAKYDEPARFDFEEAVLAGERSEDRGARFRRCIEPGRPRRCASGPARVHRPPARQRRAELRRRASPRRSRAAPPGEWRAMPTRDGLRVMRLKSISPAKPAKFEDLGGVVLQDWTDAVMAEQRSEAVRALARNTPCRSRKRDELRATPVLVAVPARSRPAAPPRTR